jgi:hypothetical protein
MFQFPICKRKEGGGRYDYERGSSKRSFKQIPNGEATMDSEGGIEHRRQRKRRGGISEMKGGGERR